MFGDVGHGIIMSLFGAWLVICEESLTEKAKKMNNEIFDIFFAGRYIILMMGLFSIYTGTIYNDVFSKSLNVFGSSWIVNYNSSTIMENPMLILNPTYDTKDSSYPYGVDPIWQVADNKIIFLNSFKMKLSIIFGVAHMLFGVCLSVVNMIQFRNKISIVLEFLPQILFLTLLFGYMVFLMIFKWFLFNAHPDTPQIYSPGCAPSILTMFINMMLFKDQKALDGCNEYFFDGQKTVQFVLIMLALICIPWMLLGKPLYIIFTKKSNHEVSQRIKSHHDCPDFHYNSFFEL